MFDLATACEYVDHTLARDLRMQIKERPKIDIRNGVFQVPFENTTHDKCKGALDIFGLTSGKPNVW